MSGSLVHPFSFRQLETGIVGDWILTLRSFSYSGAPYFSSMGAMRFGADLAHVICEPGAGTVIKT